MDGKSVPGAGEGRLRNGDMVHFSLPSAARRPRMGALPRTARAFQGGFCYHALNRGNGRRTVFHKDADYVGFLKLLREAGEGTPIRLVAFCLIQEGDHLLTVVRYAERNALRAGLAARAQDWPWCSAAPAGPVWPALDPGPVPRPGDWLRHVKEPQTAAEVGALRECLRRGRPFGDGSWRAATAGRLGLEASLRPLGRPRKQPAAPASLFERPPAE